MPDEKYYVETIKTILLKLLDTQELVASLAVVLKERGLLDEAHHQSALQRIKALNIERRANIEKLGGQDLTDFLREFEGPIQ